MSSMLNISDPCCDYTLFEHIINRILILLILVFAVVYIFLIFRTNINWDEFSFLSRIYNYQNGRPVGTLQSFYVHLFGWLTNIKGWEIEQIISARFIQLIILFSCMGLLYAISRRFFSVTEALLTVFLVLSYTDIIRHGFSFRYDPICLFFFLLSLYLMLKGKIISAVFAGLFLSLSFLTSIKTILYLPTIVALFVISIHSSKNRKQTIKIYLIFAFCSICWLSILYLWHSYMLSNTVLKLRLPQNLMKVEASISAAGSKVLWTGKFFPRSTFIFRSFLENSGTWFVIISGFFLSIIHLFSSQDRKRYSMVLSFILPLSSLLFYRNAFSYFFVFIIPPALIISGVYFELSKYYKKQGHTNFAIILVLAPVIIATVNSAKLINYRLKDHIQSQRELITLIHKIFPEPVPYIDRNGMIASFPSVGFFMSTWGIEDYRKKNIPIMRSILEKQQPKFLIADTPILRIDDERWFGQDKSIYRLLDKDYNILKKNFIPQWGALYVPGKSFNQLSKGKMQMFEILIEGKYTVEADKDINIDGKHVVPGEVVLLTKGQHRIESAEDQSVVLRWGANLYRPNKSPSKRIIYVGL